MHWLVVLLALVAGCAGMNESPRGEPLSADSPAANVPHDAVDIEASPLVVSPPAKAELPAVTGLPPPVLAPAKAAPAVVAATVVKLPPPKQDDPATVIAPVAALLDVAGLRARLRDTAAIGILAKISLRKKVDDLLESFRTHYDGGQKTSLAALRKPYDELVMKVLDMLQDGDPSLARTISNSREAIWGILADRERFRLMN
jgi:hypothetical protein